MTDNLKERARELLAAEMEAECPPGDYRPNMVRKFATENLSWLQRAAVRAIEKALSLPTVSAEARNAVIEECANAVAAIESPYDRKAQAPDNGAYCNALDDAEQAIRAKSLPTPPEEE